MRRLATRIWNVEGGTVETYPGTLDEYMDSCRRRQADGDGKPAQSARVQKPARAPTPAQQPQQAQPQQAQPQPARDAGKDQKRREHEVRQHRAQEKKLSAQVERLEQEIAKLEAAQAERSAQLADPEVYADKARSQTLIEEFRTAQRDLEQVQSRWETALTELEAAKAAVAKAG